MGLSDDRTHVDRALTPHQRDVMHRVLREEGEEREHVVVYLSGAHAYGFPSPDSDLDLKAIHVAPTEALLGLSPPKPTFDRAEIIDGVEIDYTSNELAHALRGILAGNGNFIERVLGRTVAQSSEWLEELREVTRGALSRRVHRHYRGFAESQWKDATEAPTAKRLLYVLRTAVTGIHLLETGELEADLSVVADRYVGVEGDVAGLIAAKRAGERVALSGDEVEAWRPRVGALFERLDRAREESALPEEVEAGPVEAWLVGVRRGRVG